MECTMEQDDQLATGDSYQEEHEPVCIGEVDGPLQAEIARGYLEQAGFTVHLLGEAVGGVYGLVIGPLGAVRIFVPAAQAAEAAQIFAELDFTSSGDNEDDEDDENDEDDEVTG